MVPQKTTHFTHEFVEKVLWEQEKILLSIKKEESWTLLAKLQMSKFLDKITRFSNKTQNIIGKKLFKILEGSLS